MSEKIKYITGIDGLRTLAVVAVLLYHLLPQYVPGGFLGVPLFFVISGYLMTALLMKEWEDTGNIRILYFYGRRIRRLWPALFVFLVLSGSILLWLNPQYLNHFRAIFMTSFLGVNNFWQLASDSSYFAQMTELSPFANLWSLSIENQFYIVWPLIFLAATKFLETKQGPEHSRYVRLFFVALCLLSLASCFFMGWSRNALGINQAYYNTFSRLYALLFGAILAFLYHRNRQVRLFASRWFGLGLGLVSTGILLYQIFTIQGEAVSTYQLGLVSNTFFATLLLYSVLACKPVNALLTNRFFSYMGSRSYEIYLWQYPVMVTYAKEVGLTGKHLWLHTVLQIALILLLAEITHRLVQFWVKEWKHYKVRKHFIEKRKFLTLGALCLLLLGNFSVAFAVAPNEKKTADQLALEKQLKAKAAKLDEANEEASSNRKTYPQNKEVVAAAEKVQVPAAKMSAEEIKEVNNIPLTVVGDSVLVGASSALQGLDGACYIDAKVGRHMDEALPILKTLKEQDNLKENIVLNLGNNGEIKQEELDQIIDVIGDRKLFLVNTNVKRYWQTEANTMMEQAAKDHAQVYYIDWKSIADQYPAWFGPDGIHMGETGDQVYANLILKSVLQAEKKN